MMNDSSHPVKIVSATYKPRWDDGFGARGWKINDSIRDPEVIASTAETGAKLPTSVFVHDIVDHHLCGLPLSGHRNEATALVLLYERTGSDPTPDFEQMIKEDIFHGRINGESMKDFLPDKLKNITPKYLINDNKLSIGYLIGFLGEEPLKLDLLQHFFDLGKTGRIKAIENWRKTGLDFSKRELMGIGIQSLLKKTDDLLIESDSQTIRGDFIISNDSCLLQMDNKLGSFFEKFNQ